MTFTYLRGALRAPDNEGAGGGEPPPASPPPAAPPTSLPPASPPPAGPPVAQAAPYAVPEAYKDKPWAAKIKTEEDVWKQIDTLDALKGKKSIAPDFSKATPAEIEEYLSQTRPADVKAYEFGKDVDPALNAVLGESMLKYGISAYQANGVIKAFQEAEKAQFTPEGMAEMMKGSFGDDWKKVGGTARNLTQANLSAEDKAALDKLPNQDLALVYRLVNNLTKAYGIEEKGGAHTGGGTGAPAPVDLDAKAKEIRTQLDGLSRKPHTVEERDKLVNELDAIYKQKVKK